MYLVRDYIKRRFNPRTKVEASRLKTKIEKRKLRDFDNDVVEYNYWVKETETSITAEEGEGYNKYLRQLFREYLTSDSEGFLEVIKEENRL